MSTSTVIRNLESETILRVSWRLLPFLIAAYLVNYIDRVNVGFAALQMNKAVGIDPKTYGLGAGIFFLGYFLLEVPSNLALQRFGARTWIARIMITWGIVSAAFALIGGPTRSWYCDSAWRCRSWLLPRRDPYILLVSRALSGDHRRHLYGGSAGGRPDYSPIRAILYDSASSDPRRLAVIFILEAAGGAARYSSLLYLTDGPQHALWLTPEQRQWLMATLRLNAARASHFSRLGLA